MTHGDQSASNETQEQEPIPFAEFLEAMPPGANAPIEKLRVIDAGLSSSRLYTPDLQLHCGSDSCGGLRFFVRVGERVYFAATGKVHGRVFLSYQCRNCRGSAKTFAITYVVEDAGDGGHALKIGEWPAFGPPAPPRLISLVGPDRDAFLKGRRAENQGLGIGAFAYYRRVVEDQKNRLLDEIIIVARRTEVGPEMIGTLEAAKKETQFSKAVHMVKDAIPPTLRIDGHNPLMLLHSALSDGLHARSDEECLELAASIRVVLQELAERAAVALKDHAELRAALSRINRKV